MAGIFGPGKTVGGSIPDHPVPIKFTKKKNSEPKPVFGSLASEQRIADDVAENVRIVWPDASEDDIIRIRRKTKQLIPPTYDIVSCWGSIHVDAHVDHLSRSNSVITDDLIETTQRHIKTVSDPGMLTTKAKIESSVSALKSTRPMLTGRVHDVSTLVDERGRIHHQLQLSMATMSVASTTLSLTDPILLSTMDARRRILMHAVQASMLSMSSLNSMLSTVTTLISTVDQILINLVPNRSTK